MAGIQDIGVELDVVIAEPVAVEEISEDTGRARAPIVSHTPMKVIGVRA